MLDIKVRSVAFEAFSYLGKGRLEWRWVADLADDFAGRAVNRYRVVIAVGVIDSFSFLLSNV